MSKHGWTYKKLGEVLVFDKRFNGIPKEEQPKIVKFIHVSAEVLKNLQSENGNVRLLSTGLFSASTTEELAGEYINKAEVVTIPTGGGACIKYYKGRFVDSGNILGISSSPNISLKFIYLCMIAKTELINSYFRGASIKHPYMPDIYKISVPVPPLAEQEAIVAELDEINEAIEDLQQQVADLDTLAQSTFYDMFGDPVVNSKGYQTTKIGELYKVSSSKRILQSEWQNKGVPFYKVADIVNLINAVQVVPLTFIKESTYEELKRQGQVPVCGDILITSRGTLGQCYIIKDEDRFYFQDGMITWLSQKTESPLPIYMMSLFSVNNFRNKLIQKANSSTVAYLSISQIANNTIPVPPLSLQQEFAEKVEAIESAKAELNAQIAEMQTLLASRMDYYFD